VKRQLSGGFSLVEVVIALGIAAFALLTLLTLLPTGIKSNRVSVEDATATSILTLLEADLRNSHPLLANGKSQFFGLPLPYSADSTGKYSVNTSLLANTLTPSYTVATDVEGNPIASGSTVHPHFQATVIYITLPVSPSLAPVEARLIVSWPYQPTTTTPSDLSNPAKVTGFIDAYVTFPSP
jgi:uncharacterized protein (TIGR02598 family)